MLCQLHRLQKRMNNLDVFIVTGLSGSGKSLVLRILEDSGFFCVDNIPVILVDSLLKVLSNQNRTQIAIAIDARDEKSLKFLVPEIISLKEKTKNLTTLFISASNTYLIKRYSETRRRHPFSFLSNQNNEENMAPTIGECIDAERSMLGEIEKVSIKIDTSGLKPSDLKHRIRELIQLSPKNNLIVIQSFAYKEGIPPDSDLVFDARCIPNPFYENNLKDLTGKDNQVVKFLKKQEKANTLISEILNFLNKWLPFYLHKERSYFCISIGCTGGRHRSVFCTEELAKELKKNWTTSIRHRNLL